MNSGYKIEKIMTSNDTTGNIIDKLQKMKDEHKAKITEFEKASGMSYKEYLRLSAIHHLIFDL